MTVMLATGLGVMLVATINILDVARRKGEQFEYAGALFLGELGLMLVVAQMFPSNAFGLLITAMFGLSMLVTAVVWWRLFQRWKRDAEQRSR